MVVSATCMRRSRCGWRVHSVSAPRVVSLRCSVHRARNPVSCNQVICVWLFLLTFAWGGVCLRVSLCVWPSALYFPGPGRYNPPTMVAVPPKPAFESPFLSFAERFGAKHVLDVPGPGAYETPTSLSSKPKGRGGGGGSAAGVGGMPPAGSEPAVSWVRVPTAPSIPSREQSFGYEESNKGQLVRQAPDQPGHSGKGAGKHFSWGRAADRASVCHRRCRCRRQ